MSTAIVLAAYGSRHLKAAAAMNSMIRRAGARWPDVRLEPVVASHHIRRMMEDEGDDVESLEDVLTRLSDDDVKRVAIQSLHVIPGGGFDKMRHTARKFMKKGAFSRVELGEPLLGAETEDEMQRVAEAVKSEFPDDGAPASALLLMAHGSRHHGHSYYQHLDQYLRDHVPHAHLGAMKLEPSLDTVIKRFRETGIKRVTLQPLMFASGYHVAEDMSGNHDDSWQTRLESEGFEVESVKRGLGEYDAFARIWMDHLSDAMGFLDRR